MRITGKAGALLAAVGLTIGASGFAARSTAERAKKLDDAEIAAIVVAANSIDVRYGEIARERAVDARVQKFAETMVTDHNAVNKTAAELVGRLGVTPKANDVSRSLEQAAAETRKSLESKQGAAFDRAYIANEVSYHKAVLKALDEQLIPNASNDELRQTLTGVRPAFEAHLRHAEELLHALGGA